MVRFPNQTIGRDTFRQRGVFRGVDEAMLKLGP